MSKPNIDASHDGRMHGAMKGVLRNFLMGVDDMLPAVVLAYDDAHNRATVRPLVMMGDTDGRKISRAAVSGIPTLRLGGGGFFLRFPIKAGDFGWIKACDRDISLILQSSGGEDWPNTERLHSFSDALFIPDTVKDWVIDPADASALVIQSTDGSTKISIDDGVVTISGAAVNVDSAAITLTGDVTIAGDVSVTGDVATIGALTNNGVSVGSTHTHSGVTTGSGNSGPPV